MFSFIRVALSLSLLLTVQCAPTLLENQVGTDVETHQVNFAASPSSSNRDEQPTTVPAGSGPFLLRTAASDTSQNFLSTAVPEQPLVMAYYPDWAGPSYPPENIDFSRFDWIDFAFALPTEAHDIAWDTGEAPDLLRRLVAAGHAAGTKIKLSVGGWTGSKYFSQAVATPDNRYQFASNILSVYRNFSLDGIDLDWEYPGRQGAEGNEIDPQDSNNFLLFLHCLRSVLPIGARITAAAQTVPFTDSSGQPTKDVSQFAGVLDWLLLMNYDLWGSSSTPGPNAPLNDGCQNSTQPEGNAVAAFNKWTYAGFPASQLVLGLPAYGYISKSNARGLRQRRDTHFNETRTKRPRNRDPASRSIFKVHSEEGGTDGEITFRELVEQGALVLTRPADSDRPAFFDAAKGFERQWDSCSSTPYLRSPSGRQIVTYDDPDSLHMKAEFARRVGMLGVNMFDTHGDTEQWHMINAARMALGRS
ncbi:putative glyco 18 [Lyophyllum shimeji]|uniref:Glyco 18 n=1 Tax=Lyophyllum shimeji TaxID=47721 RepID=A0A9P3PDF6_LYOSH|nr:putative glyco 18 [Lyophyllum shimeji]